MTKEEKVIMMACGRDLLIIEKILSNRVPKWFKYKIVRPGHESVYVISNYPYDVYFKMTDKGFIRML